MQTGVFSMRKALLTCKWPSACETSSGKHGGACLHFCAIVNNAVFLCFLHTIVHQKLMSRFLSDDIVLQSILHHSLRPILISQCPEWIGRKPVSDQLGK